LKIRKSRNTIETEEIELFFNDFSLKEAQPNVDLTLQEPILPQYCRQAPGTPPCNTCTALCSYDINNVFKNNTTILTQNDLIEELSMHKHPKSRVTNEVAKSQRTTIEAAIELAHHYVYAHQKKRPEGI
jgi:hypothetical protein